MSALKFSLTDEFNVEVSIHETNSFMVEPESDDSYKIALGKSVILTCTVVSIARPQRIWSKRTYQGYEAVESQKFMQAGIYIIWFWMDKYYNYSTV